MQLTVKKLNWVAAATIAARQQGIKVDRVDVCNLAVIDINGDRYCEIFEDNQESSKIWVNVDDFVYDDYGDDIYDYDESFEDNVLIPAEPEERQTLFMSSDEDTIDLSDYFDPDWVNG